MVRIDAAGPYTIDDTQTTLDAAVGGTGLADVLEWRVAREVRAGTLRIVRPGWASTGAGLHMSYPSRRHSHPALRELIDIVRRQNGRQPLT